MSFTAIILTSRWPPWIKCHWSRLQEHSITLINCMTDVIWITNITYKLIGNDLTRTRELCLIWIPEAKEKGNNIMRTSKYSLTFQISITTKHEKSYRIRAKRSRHFGRGKRKEGRRLILRLGGRKRKDRLLAFIFSPFCIPYAKRSSLRHF